MMEYSRFIAVGPRPGDIYEQIFKLAMDKAVKLSVRWIPSHLKDDDERPPSVSLDDVKGNRLADELAGKAATRLALPLHVAGPCLYYGW